MAYSAEKGIGGAASGAALGAAFAAPTGGLSVPIGALIGAFGGAGMGFLGGGKQKNIDISAELARIRAQLNAARAAAVTNVRAQAGQIRARQTQDLAAAGILRSPVRSYQTQRTDDAELAAIGQVEGDFASKGAQIESQLLSQLLGQRFQNEQQRGQQRAALFGTIGSVAGNLLLAKTMQQPGAQIANNNTQNTFFGQPSMMGTGPAELRGPLSITQPMTQNFPGMNPYASNRPMRFFS
jgi:hypothetical protein